MQWQKLSSALLITVLLSGCSSKLSSSDIPGEKPVSASEDRLEVLKLSGMIMDSEKNSVFNSMNSISDLKQSLRRAAKNKHVKGILLRIDTPGGTVATSQEIHALVENLRLTGKPVVASMADVAASGGYYVACACNKIVAEPGTLTGSIGVIMNLVNLESAEKKLGIAPLVIKSGLYKDIASPNRPMTAAEKQLLQGIIQDSYEQFTEAVAKGRNMPLAQVVKLSDGRIYSGRQALKVGLVDELGGYDQALASLQTLAQKQNGTTSEYKVDENTQGQIWKSLSKLLGQASINNSLETLLPVSLNSSFNKMPLWMMQ